MKETYINTKEIDWEVAEEYPPGAMRKILNEGSETAPRAILLKVQPGWKMEQHTHIYTELHYVIEGEYMSRDRVYSAGSFRMIPRHTDHGPFTTNMGALIMVVWMRDPEK
jgi:anti-sigma factor ChrR (cupin superfamily)